MHSAVWRQIIPVGAMAIVLAMLGVGATSSVGANEGSRPTPIEAVTQTMYSYGYELDSGTIDGLMALFTNDATAHYVLNGTTLNLNGKQAIRDFLGPNTNAGGNHNLLNPLVKTDGDRATGTFNLWRVQPAPTTCPASGSVAWLAGRYDNVFVNQGGRWLIKHLSLVLSASGSFEGCKALP